MEHSQTLLILVGSPRRTGNTATLAEGVRRGAAAAGHRAVVRFIDDYVSGFLRNCRTCRQEDGSCAIPDQFRTLFVDDFLPASGVVFCTPLYWYGVSAQTKAFFDRMFCYQSASSPDHAQTIQRMSHKRLGLVIASEETYPSAGLGVIQEIQEYARYTRSELVGVVRGFGNRHGEVRQDPNEPVQAAERLGQEFFLRKYSDYCIDTERSAGVWSA
ncbi:flavodoxin family protein [Castellaniella sp.]|uniref:flavodoxin family protein n=1 Tax=Castellaniella sp. TaxID=1955812 RepID=UPI0035637A24